MLKTSIIIELVLASVICVKYVNADESVQLQNAIINRFNAIQNVSGQYEQIFISNPTPSNEKIEKIIGSKAIIGAQYDRCIFNYFEGRARYERWPSDAPRLAAIKEYNNPDPIHAIRLFSKERCELSTYRYSLNDKKKTPVLGIIEQPGAMVLPPMSIIDTAIGLREFAHPKFLTVDSIKTLSFEHGKNNNALIIMRRKNPGQYEIVWTFDNSQKGMPLTSVVLTMYLGDNVPADISEISCSKFIVLNDVALPLEIKLKHSSLDNGKDLRELQNAILNIQHWECPDKKNDVDPFLIEWPIGAKVLDKRTQRTFIINDKPRRLDEKSMVELLQKQDAELEKRKAEIGIQPTTTPSN